jgi:hypothetical protein
MRAGGLQDWASTMQACSALTVICHSTERYGPLVRHRYSQTGSYSATVAQRQCYGPLVRHRYSAQ